MGTLMSGRVRHTLFKRLRGLAIDDQGQMLVCNSGSHRVHVLARDDQRAYDSPEQFVLMNSFGVQDDLFEPAGVAVDAEGRIFVSCTRTHRIYVFDA